jgi:acetyl-CoA synthetase
MKRALPRKENAMKETDMAYTEELVFRPLPQLVIEANVNPQEFATAQASARADSLGYWEDAAQELDWFRKWDKVLDDSDAPSYQWFKGAQCNIVFRGTSTRSTSRSAFPPPARKAAGRSTGTWLRSRPPRLPLT